VTAKCRLRTCLRAAGQWSWALLVEGGAAFRDTVKLHFAGQLDLLGAALSYYVFCSLIPMLLLTFSIVGHVAGGAPSPDGEFRRLLEIVLPFAASWAPQEAEGILRHRGLFGGVGLFLLLWIGVRVVDIMEIGLNRVWRVTETRGYFRRKALSFGVFLVAGGLAVGSVAVTAFVFGRPFLWLSPPGLTFGPYAALLLVRFLLPLAVSSLMFFLLYRWLPNRPVKKRSALAGALLAAGLWEVVKSAFAWILATTGGYQTLYGSLASVMATLIWTYFTCVIFFLGGAMAAVCEERHGAAAARGADASPAGDGELD